MKRCRTLRWTMEHNHRSLRKLPLAMSRQLKCSPSRLSVPVYQSILFMSPQNQPKNTMKPSTNICPACDGHGCTHVNGYKLDTCQVCEGARHKKQHCPACGTEMGINPLDGKLGCPHVACCYVGETPKAPAPRCGKCGAWLHETEQKHGCIMCQAKEAK